MPLSHPGWVVTSLTRSPCSQTSRLCSRKPLMYCCPVRAGIAPLLTEDFGKTSRTHAQVRLAPRSGLHAELHKVEEAPRATDPNARPGPRPTGQGNGRAP